MYAFVLYPYLVQSLSSLNVYIIIRIQEEILDVVKKLELEKFNESLLSRKLINRPLIKPLS